MSLDIGFASDLGVSPELIQKFYQNQWKRKIALSDNIIIAILLLENGCAANENLVEFYRVNKRAVRNKIQRRVEEIEDLFWELERI